MEPARADAGREDLPVGKGGAAHVRTGSVFSRLRALARRGPPGDWHVGQLTSRSWTCGVARGRSFPTGRSSRSTACRGTRMAGRSRAAGRLVDRTRGVSSSTRWMAAATIRSSASRCARSSPRDGCRAVARTSPGHLWGTPRPSSAKMTVSRRRPILAIRGFVRTVRISPDGRWLAFDTNDGGPSHVYVVSISGKGERVAVSPRPGESPRWSHDGRQLFFRTGTAMMAVDVRETGEQIELGAERKLFDAEMASEYAVGPSGDFYTLAPVPGAATQTHIQLRTRWFDEVDRLMRGSERARERRRRPIVETGSPAWNDTRQWPASAGRRHLIVGRPERPLHERAVITVPGSVSSRSRVSSPASGAQVCPRANRKSRIFSTPSLVTRKLCPALNRRAAFGRPARGLIRARGRRGVR